MVTPDQIRAHYVRFGGGYAPTELTDEVIQHQIDIAYRACDSAAYGALLDDQVEDLVCDALATNLLMTHARTVERPEATPFFLRARRRAQMVGAARPQIP